MNEAPIPPKKPSKIALVATALGGLVIVAGLFFGFYHQDSVPWAGPPSSAEIMYAEVVTPEWAKEEGFNLPPAGNLPSLQTAMRRTPELQRRVDAFAQSEEGQIFAGYQKADAEITAILLLWAGADLSNTQKTREGNDPRVEKFIRAVYAMGGAENVTNNPRIGPNPWPRLFAHYKVRLIAQTPGGQAPFKGGIEYDLRRDRMAPRGGLDRGFFGSFAAFLKNQSGATGYRNNLLAYIDAVTETYDDKDRQTLALIR